MPFNERSKDVFEHIGHYPQPPLINLQPITYDKELMTELALKNTTLAKTITKIMIHLSGFNDYYKKFPQIMEQVLRRSNFRFPGLYAPVISATIGIIDDPEKNNPIDRAVSLVFGARSLYFDLFAGRLSPDEYNGQPLEMGQYPNLFSTSLLLGGKKVALFKSTHIDRITVMYKGQMYQVELTAGDEEQKLIQFKQNLEHLISEQLPADQETSPGILTAASDQTQRMIFRRLIENPVNRQSMEALKHSFLTLCLDLDTTPHDLAEATRLAHSRNYGNRWFHSSLQLVVFGNAKACTICNFTTYLDGNMMMRGTSEIQKRGQKIKVPDMAGKKSVDSISVTKLHWQIPAAALERAKKDYERILDHQEQATYVIEGIGRDVFKTRGIAAVPAFMLALQQATEKLCKRPVWIQQFLTMTRYRCMDVELINVSTPEVRQFLEYTNDPKADKPMARDLFINAITSQTKAIKNKRKYLTPVPIMHSYVRNSKGLKGIYIKLIFAVVMTLLRWLRQFELQPRDVIVSHPDIYHEAPIVGRPGIRLPYVRCFGLHYQIYADKIVITMMPGLKWDVPNAQVVQETENSLKQILQILE
jgi:predicted RNA-binding protein